MLQIDVSRNSRTTPNHSFLPITASVAGAHGERPGAVKELTDAFRRRAKGLAPVVPRIGWLTQPTTAAIASSYPPELINTADRV